MSEINVEMGYKWHKRNISIDGKDGVKAICVVCMGYARMKNYCEIRGDFKEPTVKSDHYLMEWAVEGRYPRCGTVVLCNKCKLKYIFDITKSHFKFPDGTTLENLEVVKDNIFN
jgi:hypothetical protein